VCASSDGSRDDSVALGDPVIEELPVLHPIGWVESLLTDVRDAPRQGDEGAGPAWVILEDEYQPAMDGLDVGMRAILLTWLDRARRDVLVVHPRGDQRRPPAGVFSTRSPDRPNPIGLHQVRITAIDGLRIRVEPLEAVHGTPVLDIKPVLNSVVDR
jgi:tRNA-Thr(GGU) m(6)t(6)A37 methyltransferase TsaA